MSKFLAPIYAFRRWSYRTQLDELLDLYWDCEWIQTSKHLRIYRFVCERLRWFGLA